MKTNGNDPAKPCKVLNEIPTMGEYFEYYPGLTKREFFAAMALQGLLSSSDLGIMATQNLSKMALEQANELIIQLNKEP